MKQKTYWITGASSGIGEALAQLAYDQGSRVILSARNEARLQELCKNWDPNRFFILPLDMSQHETIAPACEQAYAQWSSIDVLINNAGISQRSRADETELEVTKQIMDVNFFGSVELTRHVLPYMIEQKSGAIATVSSVAGKFSTPLRTSYSASKMALHGYFEGLRAELYSDKISVSMVIPGFIKTKISINALQGKGDKHGIMDPNQERGISPERTAKIILNGIEKKKREIYMGLVPKTRLALYVARHAPRILDVMLRNMKVT